MRSIFAKILLWSFGTLVVSLIAFVGISRFLSDRAFRRGEPLRNPLSMQAEHARQAFESGGREQLVLYLEQLYKFFPDDHHLTDARGKDVLTGEDRSSLLSQARTRPGMPGFGRGPMVMATPTADGRYRFHCRDSTPSAGPLELRSLLPAGPLGRGTSLLHAGDQSRHSSASAWADRRAIRQRESFGAGGFAAAR